MNARRSRSGDETYQQSLRRRMVLANCLGWLFIAASCGQKAVAPQAIQPGCADSETVHFNMSPMNAKDGSKEWKCEYTSGGKVARFRIFLDPVNASEAVSKDFTFQFGKGVLYPDPASDSSMLLLHLGTALRAKAVHSPSRKKVNVPFDYVILGESLSFSTSGGFAKDPPGRWTAMKLFFGEGDQEGQVFLNVETQAGRGQFAMKDSEYGDLVLAALSKVL